MSTYGNPPATLFVAERDTSFELPGRDATNATARIVQLYVSVELLHNLRHSARARPDDWRRRGPSWLEHYRREPGGSRVALARRGGDRQASRATCRRRRAPTSLDVIGIAGTAPYDNEEKPPLVFAPLSTAASGWDATIAVRTSGNARTYVLPIRGAIREVEPYAAISDAVTLAERHAGEERETFFSNAGAFAVGAAALLLHHLACMQRSRLELRSAHERSASGSRWARRAVASWGNLSVTAWWLRRSGWPSGSR